MLVKINLAIFSRIYQYENNNKTCLLTIDFHDLNLKQYNQMFIINKPETLIYMVLKTTNIKNHP